MTTPVLLMLPGMLNDAGVFDALVPALRERAELRFATLQQDDTMAAIADRAWAQLADVEPGRPLCIAGFSMGGYAAIEMLARAPRAVDALALMSTSGRPEAPEGVAVREQTMRAMQRDFPAVVDAVLKRATHAPSPALLERLRPMMLGVGAEVGIRQTRAIMGRADHRDVLAQRTRPTLVICGREDRITPPALSEELAAGVPGATLVLVDGAGHMLPCERPEEVVLSLAALLARAAPSTGDRP